MWYWWYLLFTWCRCYTGCFIFCSLGEGIELIVCFETSSSSDIFILRQNVTNWITCFIMVSMYVHKWGLRLYEHQFGKFQRLQRESFFGYIVQAQPHSPQSVFSTAMTAHIGLPQSLFLLTCITFAIRLCLPLCCILTFSDTFPCKRKRKKKNSFSLASCFSLTGQ